tara:strand:- start:13965 stop:14966 length:1002 start_codon:yes stop_codon:yes gene_type:complete
MSFEIYSGNINNWNNHIVDLPNHSFYQIFEWGDYSKSQGWEILRLIQFKEKKIISMSQILYKKQFGVYIFWLPGGPSGSLENWFDEVRSLINDRFGSLFYFRVNSSSLYNNSVKKKLIFLGWRKPLLPFTKELRMELALNDKLEDIKSRFTSNWRHNLNRSKKYDLKVSKVINPNVDEMMKIYKEMENLKSLSKQYNREEVVKIFKYMNNKIVLYQCRNKSNILLSFRAIIINKDKASDILAASSIEARKVYASYATLWAIIEYCVSQKVKTYDLSGVDPEKNIGVYNFKKGTGSKLINCIGEWEYSKMRFIRIAIFFRQISINFLKMIKFIQ